jgi:hypothetical protein
MFGNQGLGMLVRLWCFVASQGKRRPGWSLDTRGKPIPRAALVDAVGGSDTDFDSLLHELTRNGHVSASSWNKRGVIVFPAMSRRADTYAKRKVRTLFEQSSGTNSTYQTVHTKYKKVQRAARAPKTSALRAHARTTGKTTPASQKLVTKIIHTVIDKHGAKRLDFPSLKEECKSACAKAHVLYTPDLIGRTLESALAVRAKQKHAGRR